MQPGDSYNNGTQPLDALMRERELENKDLAAAGGAAITFKVVKKARNGRRLTRRMQLMVLEAVNGCLSEEVTMNDIFNYKG